MKGHLLPDTADLPVAYDESGEVGGDRFETSKGCRLVDLKNIHNLKVRVMFYLVGIFRTSGPGDRISGNPERTA